MKANNKLPVKKIMKAYLYTGSVSGLLPTQTCNTLDTDLTSTLTLTTTGIANK